jgi:hypothetical protein
VSYAAHSSALACTLAHLLYDVDTDLDAAGYEQALLARSAVLALLRDVHTDVAGMRRPRGTVTTAVLEQDPVAGFGRALVAHPRVSGTVSPTEALSHASSTTAGRRWADAARHALLAHHHWTEALPQRWTPPLAWSLIADAAAIAGATALLDHDLATAAAGLGSETDAAALTGAAHSGLRTAAAAVHALARSGPLEDVAIERQPRTRHHVILVRRTGDLPRAQAHLAALLNAAATVRPAHAHHVAAGLARGAAITARTLCGSSQLRV